MMTSSQIRQSFLDFFKSKQHTIVPSSSLMPDAPNLLFTNAGMNQFVPIFLGQRTPDVDKWPGAIPGLPTRAADTQKCIRAGGKHNDLEDVGLDTYHHTFFEMLGNWSFGDYFKKEAIEWAWELVTSKKWFGFPPKRLYATVFSPHFEWDNDRWQNELKTAVEYAADRLKGIDAEIHTGEREGAGALNYSDAQAASFWAEYFIKAGLNPFVHIVPGNRKDNFWMMGDTGPCGPCSEIHIDLTPAGDTQGSLVNKGDARCIEIWNLVFIQFNANPDGSFSPLPATHVDTGMGFERVTSIIQCTKNFTNFSGVISNYETDIFRPIFDALEKLSGKKYGSTLPRSAGLQPASASATIPASEVEPTRSGLKARAPSEDQIALDIAFRVIADHIRTLSFAIADGIQPGNTDRNYVLRRILRRAVRYGRTLGFHEPFFYKLVDVLADTMGDVFPEIRAKKKHVQEVIRTEEEAFNKTLDRGIEIFEANFAYGRAAIQMEPHISELASSFERVAPLAVVNDSWWQRVHEAATAIRRIAMSLNDFSVEFLPQDSLVLRTAAANITVAVSSLTKSPNGTLVGDSEIDILQNEIALLRTAVSNLSVAANRITGEIAFQLYDTYGFPLDLTELMARERGLAVDKEGFERLMEEQRARARAAQKKTVVALQEGMDLMAATEFVGYENTRIRSRVLTVIPQEKRWGVVLTESPFYAEMGGQVGDTGIISLGANRWRVIDTKKVHSTWLHLIEGDEPPAIGPVDFVEVDVARRNAIQRHHTVTHLFHWALHEVVSKDASQKGSFVGPDKLTFDFNSAPLTPQQIANIEKLVNERVVENADVSWSELPYAEVKPRKDILQFFGEKYGDTVRVVQIGGHAAQLDGYSMELCGGTHTRMTGEIGLFRIVSESAIAAGIRRIEAVAGLTAYETARRDLELIKSLSGKVNSPVHELEKKIESLLEHQKALEKQLKSAQQREASNIASNLKAHAMAVNGIPLIIQNLGAADGDFLQSIADAIKSQFKGVIVLGGLANNAVSLVAAVSPEYTSKVQAGKIIQQIAPIVGGKGGGKPDNARGGGKDASKLDEALAKAKSLLG